MRLKSFGITLMLLIGAACLRAGETQPNWLLNMGGTYGNYTSPSYLSATAYSGGNVSLEWMPDAFQQVAGIDVGYDERSVKFPELMTDNDITLALQIFPATFGNTTLTLEGGVGYNATAFVKTSNEDIDTDYAAFVEPGVRVVVFSHLAIDAGLHYQVMTPHYSLHQSLGATIGLSVPLDGAFTETSASSVSAEATPVSTPVPTAVPTEAMASTPVAIPVATPTPVAAVPATETTEGSYVVRKGDYLWKIAANPDVFDDSRYWPLLLDSNQDQIQDPNALTPGMVLRFKLRRFYTAAELAAARKREWLTPHQGQ